MATDLQLTPEAVKAFNAMAKAFAPAEKKEKSEKSVISINGKIGDTLMTDKEIEATALKLATTGAVIKKYALVGEVKVDLPVSIPGVTAEEADEETETTEGE